MNPARPARLEKMLVLLLAASFALPLALGGWLRWSGDRSFGTVWLRNATLHGTFAVRRADVPWSWAALAAGEWQAGCAERFDERFAGRELLIRGIDEVYFRVFHSSNVGVLVGPRRSLIESIYADEYCLQRGPRNALAPLARDLRRLQDVCDARGTAFALLITPSKAAIYPEELPAGWRRRRRQEPRYYDDFVPLLREQGVRCVDGHRLAADAKATARVPLFPLGGVHWNEPTALTATNALLASLAGAGLRVQPVARADTTFSDRPTGQDVDLIDLLNIMTRPSYPVARTVVQPVEGLPTQRPNAVLVGGSFLYKTLAQLDASGQFSELEFYSYYKLAKYCQLRGELHLIARPTPPVDFAHEVFAADALVLEANEQSLHEPRHLTAFLQDALAALPDPKMGKEAFRYEGVLHYRWGDALSFVAGRDAVNAAATEGFATPGAAGAYTVGSVAAIRFLAAPPSGDVRLEVDAGAFLVDTRLPEQRTGVYVNGRFIGEWTWRDPAVSRRALTIPGECLGGGEVRLEFRIARPGSPAEFGLGRDSRKYGLLVSRVCLREVGDHP